MFCIMLKMSMCLTTPHKIFPPPPICLKNIIFSFWAVNLHRIFIAEFEVSLFVNSEGYKALTDGQTDKTKST